MSNLGRAAITAVAALLIGALSYGDSLDYDRSGTLAAIFFSPAFTWAYLAIPLLTVALVNRWWALSVAFVPLAVAIFLHSATDYVYPFHEDPYPVITVLGTVFLFGVASLGFLLRLVFSRIAVAVGQHRKVGSPNID